MSAAFRLTTIKIHLLPVFSIRPSLASIRSYSSMSSFTPQEVFIVSAVRTPIGTLNGALKSQTGVQLGTTAVKAAISRAGIEPSAVEELYMGQVIQAGAGQSPARQVALAAGCEASTDSTTINKVCASGMKAITLAAQGMMLGGFGGSQKRGVVVAGGMESMSNAPFLVPRTVPGFGGFQTKDSVQTDGLWDVSNNFPMGNCAEHIAAKFSISRESQDEHALESYRRAAEAWSTGKFEAEIAPVTLKGPKGETVVAEDEDYKKVIPSKVPTLKPVFQREGGTITPANASGINDGASAVVLMTGEKVQEHGVKPMAKILGFADAAIAPIEFPIAPTVAIPIALKNAGVSADDVALYEINEAFSVVARAAEKILNIDPSKLNVNGGGVALGHPIGSSGCRIVVSLVHALQPGQIGVAGICNGGGAATAVVIQRL
ncbi:Acetyl CoA acyltransferase 2 [Phaffia rhodozyma]|uniref:acetyl-CoA C-acetyltransferase n=1 Tax=Phaffia rhodozyma TaxID=264483 RepID=A0A0F7SRU2_PHARH|nr:Acetyl CoA acyltransferase 2 [Phaffia rhodozyma]